ncbi:hypothetical protein Hanom_Chr01g00018581 [Helianthus anomalus]
MKKLRSNDEAFRLSWKTLSEIIDFIRSRKIYRQWDEHARSFYLKMCTCFGVDYQHLEATPPQQACDEAISELDMLGKDSCKDCSLHLTI